MNTTTTLFGGKLMTALFEPLPDGTPVPAQEIKVRQIPVREYEIGFPLANDEAALVGFLVGKDKNFALTLAPESFEELLATGREVNRRGFFSFCQRRMEQIQRREAAEQERMLGLMAKMSAEEIRAMTQRGQELQRLSALPILSPGFVSPPAR